MDWNYYNTITQVKVFSGKPGLTVQIETHMPGVLIGKGGCFIDGLKVYLSEELNTPVNIDLKECMLWRKLYKL
jgi:ribosomal protein S3